MQMRKIKSFIVRNGVRIVAAGAGVFGSASYAMADFTLPTLPVTNLETAGTAVAALVGTYVVIKLAIRMLKGV
jgi:hypothetical protein